MEQECQRFRLLTEAEWEHCARGGKNTDGGYDDPDAVGWYEQSVGKETNLVGQKKGMVLVCMT